MDVSFFFFCSAGNNVFLSLFISRNRSMEIMLNVVLLKIGNVYKCSLKLHVFKNANSYFLIIRC